MEPSSSGISDLDDETRALKSLLDCFGSVCSLKEIASAYCEARYDVTKAGDLLYQLQNRKSNDVSHAQNDGKNFSQPKESLHEDNLRCFTPQDKNSIKSNKLSASFGIVSGDVGRTYGRFSASRNESYETTKPLKLEIKKPLVDEIVAESVSKFVPRNDTFEDKDVQEFLFSMLGDGFKLSMDMIQNVLGDCGYDVKKSMNELLTLSAKTLDKGKGVGDGVAGKCSEMETCLSEESYPNSPSTIRYSRTNKYNANLPREMLQSLFSFPEITKEEAKIKRLDVGLNRTRVVGQTVVTEPLDDHASLSSTHDASKKKLVNDDDEVDEYLILRRAVKQHWDSMKEYYEAAVDAFTKGDSKRANYLLEQGKYHNKMAREADEESAKEIVEPRKTNNQDIVTLDLQDHPSKEVLNMVKIHLRSLANIPPFRCLKLILGPDAEDRRKGRSRRLVIKLLNNESVKWSEDKDVPGTINIQLDQVDQRKLSFARTDL